MLKKQTTSSDHLFIVFLTLAAAYFFISVFRSIDLTSSDLSGLLVFNTIFISILLQAFPFILIGVLVSSVLQVFVSQDIIVRFFPKNVLGSIVVSILAGIFFPFCDCAIVPVVGRLAKKGVPLYSAVIFLLSAPLVNPIVIASTVYAFPGQPEVAVYRVLFGVTIASIVGCLFLLFPEKSSLLTESLQHHDCHCHCCNESEVQGVNIRGKLRAIGKHAGEEFFEVGRFLIIGSFLSSLMQTVFPKEILTALGQGKGLSLFIMMTAAFLLSVCSTSDAFIARSFLNQFSLGPVMGFMVVGPMIDIKNLLMLMGTFKKRFVLKLVITIFSVSFALLYFLTNNL